MLGNTVPTSKEEASAYCISTLLLIHEHVIDSYIKSNPSIKTIMNISGDVVKVTEGCDAKYEIIYSEKDMEDAKIKNLNK